MLQRMFELDLRLIKPPSSGPVFRLDLRPFRLLGFGLAQTNAGAAAICVDELNACRLQSSAECKVIRRRHRSLFIRRLGTAYRSQAH